MKSKLLNSPTAFTFDDFTLEPIHSEVPSRHAPNVSTKLGNIDLSIPIVAAPMNTVAEYEMCNLMIENGGTAVLHRYIALYELEQQIKAIKNKEKIFVAIGAAGDFLSRAMIAYDLGVRAFCIDVANGHSEICLDAIKLVKEELPDVSVMAGNVCSYEGAFHLARAGADVIRVGIGPGASCKTRLVTGHGVPQLTAIEECCAIKNHPSLQNVSIVADGGIRSSGDLVKALAIGADAAMVGGLLAGTSHSPGEVRTDMDGKQYKQFAGMASVEGRKDWFSRKNTAFVPEGVSFEVSYKGDTQKVVDELVGGLRVGMSFSNAMTLKDLTKNAKWVRVTENGNKEGNPNKRMFKK